MTDLSSEDQKLVTLARATRARTGGAQGAAARDETGRTYAAATVDLPSLQLSAAQVCVAMLLASGSRGVQACVVLGGGGELSAPDRAVLADVGDEALVVHLADERGQVTATLAGVAGG